MLVVRKEVLPRSLEARGTACCAGLPGAAPGQSEGRRSKGKTWARACTVVSIEKAGE